MNSEEKGRPQRKGKSEGGKSVNRERGCEIEESW